MLTILPKSVHSKHPKNVLKRNDDGFQDRDCGFRPNEKHVGVSGVVGSVSRKSMSGSWVQIWIREERFQEQHVGAHGSGSEGGLEIQNEPFLILKEKRTKCRR